MISATIQKAAETISRLDALRKKMAVDAHLKKKRTAQHNRQRIREREAAEKLIERVLQPFFVDQITSAAAALAATVAPEGTKVFCPTGPGGGVDATCGRGGKQTAQSSWNVSTGDVTFTRLSHEKPGDFSYKPSKEETEKEILSKWHTIAGRTDVTLKDLAKAAGAPDGTEVSIGSVGKSKTLYVHAKGPGIVQFSRVVERDREGKFRIGNDIIVLEEKERSKGLGTTLFASQVENASALGVDYIKCEATHNPRSKKIGGYYTWPRLGYDGSLDTDMLEPFSKESLPDNLKEAKRVSDLMKTPEGRGWWKDNGRTMLLKFDVAEGSQSRKVLNEYVAAKFGSEGRKSSGDDGRRRDHFGRDLGQPGSNAKSTQQSLPIIFNPAHWSQKLVDTLYPAMVKIAVVGMDGEMRRMGLQIKRGFASTKVFCPTGPGGGVDATCSRGGKQQQTQTPQFKAWFGDSKVVTKDGDPKNTFDLPESKVLTVYHGRDTEFSEFDKGKASKTAMYGGGFYFTEDRSVAESYSGGKEGKRDVVEAFLRIEKPFDADKTRVSGEELGLPKELLALAKKEDKWQTFERWQEEFWEPDGVVGAFAKVKANPVAVAFADSLRARYGKNENVDVLIKEFLREGVQNLGYDGITHVGKGGAGAVGQGDDHRVWIAFEPNQIKSATNNSGEFSTESNNIYKATGLQTKVFCATGPGGGVDATCSRGGAGIPEAVFTNATVSEIKDVVVGVQDEMTRQYKLPSFGGVKVQSNSGFYHDSDTNIISIPKRIAEVSKEEADRLCDADARALNAIEGGLYGTLVHEFGHAVDRQVLKHLPIDKGDEYFEQTKRWHQSIVVSGYGSKNRAEWVAEQFLAEKIGRTKPLLLPYLQSLQSYIPDTNPKIKKQHLPLSKSTATDLLSGLDDSGGLLDMAVLSTPYGPVDMGFLFEYPDWMKQAISEFLAETFSQPYWDELNKTTLGDIETYLQEGIRDGWSIEKMANEMVPQLLETGRYAKIRGRNIARTEAGHALNGARSMGIDSVIEELQGTGLDIQKLWHSVLGTTTRDTHRAIHGVPADQDGMWTLAGVRCRWPGDVVLPASERCNCQCTIESAFGMSDSEARDLIQGYEGPMAEASWSKLRTKVFVSTKCGGPGGTPGPCPEGGTETKPTGKPKKPKVVKPAEDGEEPAKTEGVKKFKNGKEAEEVLAKSAKQWMDGPADDYFANKAVKAYAGTSDSFRINDCLRQKCGDKGLSSKAEELKKTIDKASFPESIESHRSINPKTREERDGILAFFEKNVGQSFVDSAFVSTTANKDYAKKWSKGSMVEPITVAVHVKKGSKAIYIPQDIGKEWEVLIQSGSKFRVKSVSGGNVVMELENE